MLYLHLSNCFSLIIIYLTVQEIIVHDKTFVQCLPAEYLEAAVDRIAFKMNRELTDKMPLFISLLNGAFMFTADLMRHIDFQCNISFVKLNSYSGLQSTGNVKQLIGLSESIEGRTIVIIEDIVDSGNTLFHFINELKLYKPLEIKVAVMFYKPDACKHKINIDYLGLEIPNDFVVGYGLDFDGLGRNYRDLYKLKE